MYKNEKGKFVWKQEDIYRGIAELIALEPSMQRVEILTYVLRVINFERRAGNLSNYKIQRVCEKQESFSTMVSELSRLYKNSAQVLEALTYLASLASEETARCILDVVLLETERDSRHQEPRNGINLQFAEFRVELKRRPR